MKATAGTRHPRRRPSAGPTGLLRRLEEAEGALRAIRDGEVDAVVVAGERGPQVFTLGGVDQAYRVLIESMNEGALTFTSGMMILYANACFARMADRPLEKVIGSSLCAFLPTEGPAGVRSLLRRMGKTGIKSQMMLSPGSGPPVPVQISIQPFPGNPVAAFGMVVSDMSEARRSEAILRALAHRVVQVQESERGRVAFELHDNITQLICAALFQSQALAARLALRDNAPNIDAIQLREMLGRTAEEVERITHNLSPNILDHLGLASALGNAGGDFKARTGLPVKLVCGRLATRLAPDVELAILRILQEALRNIEKHADARHVLVSLRKRGAFVRLTIRDDGGGFDTDAAADPGTKGRLGLLSMRERAASVGGTMSVSSSPGRGTEVEAVVPLSPEDRD